MKTFIQAAQSLGYMKKGGAFKPLPKKGSKEYAQIKAKMR